jgi:tRNA A-37 threonylcarbamoyl transferase component Bud32
MRSRELEAERCPRCDQVMSPRADQTGWYCLDCDPRGSAVQALLQEASREGEPPPADESLAGSPRPSTQTMSAPKSPVDPRNSASIAAGPASPNPLAEAGGGAGPSGLTSAEGVPERLPDIAPVATNLGLDPASLVGRVLGGRYRLQGILGRGAMGVVYRGIQVALTKPYAIKVLLPSLTRDPQFDARFKQEAQIAAAIRHPGLVEVFDYGFDGGIAYYVMELLEGRNLAEHLRSSAPVSPKDAVRIVAAAADAVSAAHDKGVIHRDLKPANLFLARDSAGGEVVKVLDFGVSKAAVPDNLASPMLSASGFICGTPA